MARNRFFGLTSRVLMLIVAGLLILSYASIVVNPAKVWFISLIGIFFIPLSILNLFLLLWALKRRSKSFMIPLLALVPAFFFAGRYVRFDSDEDRIARMSHTGNTLKMVSYNVGRFALDAGEFSSRSDCADSVFAFILEQDPDYIFFVQQGDDEAGTKSNIERMMKDNPAWQELTAVKEGRVYFMDKTLYGVKPNHRWGEAYEIVEEILENGKS